MKRRPGSQCLLSLIYVDGVYNDFSLNIVLLKHTCICTSVYLEKLKYVPGALTLFDLSLLILTYVDGVLQ